jgi:cyclophilin family peptidyl-prolyl cis-trans isomerase
MDVQVGDRESRRVEFELFGKKCPMAVENFAKLCSGENVIPPSEAMHSIGDSGFADQYLPQLHYKGTDFHRVVPNFIVQGGDLTGSDGLSQLSVFGPTFDAPEETMRSKFDRRGLLGTAVSAPHLNGSQFFVLLAERAPHLDATCICFGRVVKGIDIFDEVQKLPLGFDGRPRTRVSVVGCGIE